MLSTKLKLLIISLLCCQVALAGDPIQPRERITEVDRVEQHTRVQAEMFEYLNLLKGYQDSTFVLQDIGTLSAAGTDTVFLSEKYTSIASYVINANVRAGANAFAICVWPLSDSSFAVKAATGDSLYHWSTIGVK